jgi:hypothetical protein
MVKLVNESRGGMAVFLPRIWTAQGSKTSSNFLSFLQCLRANGGVGPNYVMTASFRKFSNRLFSARFRILTAVLMKFSHLGRHAVSTGKQLPTFRRRLNHATQRIFCSNPTSRHYTVRAKYIVTINRKQKTQLHISSNPHTQLPCRTNFAYPPVVLNIASAATTRLTNGNMYVTGQFSIPMFRCRSGDPFCDFSRISLFCIHNYWLWCSVETLGPLLYSSEILVTIYQTTRRHVPEASDLVLPRELKLLYTRIVCLQKTRAVESVHKTSDSDSSIFKTPTSTPTPS